MDRSTPAIAKMLEAEVRLEDSAERRITSRGPGFQLLAAHLTLGTARNVELELLEWLQTIGKKGGLILGPTFNFQLDTALENIWAMIKMVMKAAHRSLQEHFCR